MDKKFGYLILAGLFIGAIFGVGAGAANGAALTGLGIGSLVGVFLGWFIAAIILERTDKR